jgi:transcriptional regulator with XRE-family HTH domain
MSVLDHHKLLQWRLELGLRPEPAAAEAGISYSYLSAIEYGKRVNPSLELLARLCAVYGKTLSDLFDDSDGDAA